jgi:hypothetical protein
MSFHTKRLNQDPDTGGVRDVLGDQTYESLARKGETMITAAMVTYAFDPIDRMFSGVAIGSGRPVRARSHEPHFADDRQGIGVGYGEPSLAEPLAEARRR